MSDTPLSTNPYLPLPAEYTSRMGQYSYNPSPSPLSPPSLSAILDNGHDISQSIRNAQSYPSIKLHIDHLKSMTDRTITPVTATPAVDTVPVVPSVPAIPSVNIATTPAISMPSSISQILNATPVNSWERPSSASLFDGNINHFLNRESLMSSPKFGNFRYGRDIAEPAALQKGVGHIKAGFKNMPFMEKVKMGFDGVNSLLNAINASKQLGIYNRQLDHTIKHDNKNYEMSRKSYNSQLEDRQRYREAYWRANGNGDMSTKPLSVNEYLNKYGA